MKRSALVAACLPLAKGVGYWESIAPADITKGIVTDKAGPHVLGSRLRVNHDRIAEVETLWTTTGYWLFNADNYLKYSSREKWDPISAERRDTRGTL